MRKFFSFRPSSHSGVNDNPAPSDLIKSKKLHSGATEEIGAKISAKKIHGGLLIPEDHILKPLNRCLETETSSNPYLQRSLSFSSAASRSCINEENFISLSDQSRMTSCQDDDHHVGQYPLLDNSFTPDKFARAGGSLRLKNAGQQNSPISFGVHQDSSSSNSACSSPIPLRCRTTRPTQVSSQNKVLDLYIDGEHQLAHNKISAQRNASETEEDGQVNENSKHPITRRPPRASCTAPTSPHHNVENLRSYSFREISDKSPSTRERSSNDLKPVCLQKFSESSIKRAYAFGKSTSDVGECASRTTSTVDGIYEESSDGNPTLSSNGAAQGCSFDLIPLDKKFDELWLCEAFNLQRKICFSTRGSSTSTHAELVNSQMQEHDTNEWLLKKLKELEERFNMLDEEDSESEKLLCANLSAAALLENTRRINEDRKHLAAELSLQLRSRLAERSVANERMKQFKLELSTRTWRLEKEKNELQLSLENELDRRSNEWSLKLSKFQTEEQRLRDRVRELAEQNVSLQREVSSLKGSEVEARSSVVSLEMQLNDMRANQDELKSENYNLCQALSELQEQCNRAAEQQDQIRSSTMEKERENMDLQKLLGKLNRTCNEQDKTISELRKSYSNEIGKVVIERDNDVFQLQTEKIRLTSVEQKLRRELESCRIEMESLRKENILLLNRLQENGNRHGFSLVRLNIELHTWMECLKMQSLSLLDDSSKFCGQLLDFITCKRSEDFQEVNSDNDEHSAAELTLKFNGLRRAIENFRRSLQIASAALDEKSIIQASKCTCQTKETGPSKQHKGHRSEKDLAVELKAETILTRLLKEKICSKELENEQLLEDLTSSVRTCDLLQTDIQRLQDEVSCLNHKKRDMEIQMLKKDENAFQLQHELQECKKDLSASSSILTNVTEERDHIWEEMKQLRESHMLMDCELRFLHKKIESLDEDILYKEGQISILKDSLGNKAFDAICSPNSMKEFNMQ